MHKMKLAFIKTKIETVNPVILSTTDGIDSLIYVAGLLLWLESNGAEIFNKNWTVNNYQALQKKGVKVKFESVTFLFTSNENTCVIKRLSGNEVKFWGLCELFKETEC